MPDDALTRLPDGVIEFDGYAVPPPRCDWEYALDDVGVRYRRGLIALRLRPGQWPFAYHDPDFEHRFRRGRGDPVPPECGVASIRVAPDCDDYSWRNEYVLARPSRTVPHHADASLTLWVRPQGMGGMVTRCSVHLDLLEATYRIEHLHPALPDEVKQQAETKAAKLLAFLLAEVKNRDGATERPLQVADRVRERRHRPGAWREPAPRNGHPGWSREVGDGIHYLFVVQMGNGHWRWAVCQHDGRTEALNTRPCGDADDLEQAKALADAAEVPSASPTPQRPAA
ncbi:hypothetical protein AB0C84_43490 [Actinomadura sp. NPDC048955]|uniref:hypothetical protein n=1 Tax=Actinomadura sp. NPDC048955 TaxID=3158228 RepID=UPI0033D0C94A